jgi:hypothetical protein
MGQIPLLRQTKIEAIVEIKISKFLSVWTLEWIHSSYLRRSEMANSFSFFIVTNATLEMIKYKE